MVRKVQEKLINKAIQNNYSNSILELLSDESFAIKTLQAIYHFLYNFKEENISKEKILHLLQLSNQFANELNIRQEKYGSNYRYSDIFLFDMFGYFYDALQIENINFEILYDNISSIIESDIPVNEKDLKLRILRDNDCAFITNEEAFELITKYFQPDTYLYSFSRLKVCLIDNLISFKQDCNYSVLDELMREICLNSEFFSFFSSPSIKCHTSLNRPELFKDFIFAKANGISADEYLELLKNEESILWYVAKRKYASFFEYLENNYYKSKNPVFVDYESGRGNNQTRDWFFLDEEVLSFLEEASNLIIQKNISSNYLSISGNALKLRVSVSYTGVSFCFITGNNYNIRFYDNLNDMPKVEKTKIQIGWETESKSTTLFLPYDEENIYSKKNGKFIPANIRIFSILANRFWSFTNQLQSVLLREFIDRNIDNGCYTFKDLLPYFENGKYIAMNLPPIKISDVVKYGSSLDMLMQSVYKTADFVNWNRCNLVYCYSLMKIRNKITTQSWDYLQNGINDLSHDKPFNMVQYLSERVFNKSSNFLVSDYISMCKQMKRKVNLLYTSERKLKDAHDELAIKYSEKYTPVIKIPKGSKFLKLRKVLPEEFEWIKTRKRICKEGEIQHNCVASYADYVNKDMCAIYSLVKDGNRYTIEFQKYGNRYTINQLFGVCNSDAPDEVFDYVSSFITQGASA